MKRLLFSFFFMLTSEHSSQLIDFLGLQEREFLQILDFFSVGLQKILILGCPLELVADEYVHN